MIEIDYEALDLIAGGAGQSTQTVSFISYNDTSAVIDPGIPVVSVPGERAEDPVDYWAPMPIGGGWGEVSTPVSAPVSVSVVDPSPAPCTHHSSPVPANHPMNVDSDLLRNTALQAASNIAKLDKSLEHGAFIFRTAEGALRIGEIQHGNAREITLNYSPVKGEVVVGYVHSHPDNPWADGDQNRPSRHDADQADSLRKNVYSDSNLLLYILDNESGHVFEYAAGASKSIVGANISTDMCKS